MLDSYQCLFHHIIANYLLLKARKIELCQLEIPFDSSERSFELMTDQTHKCTYLLSGFLQSRLPYNCLNMLLHEKRSLGLIAIHLYYHCGLKRSHMYENLSASDDHRSPRSVDLGKLPFPLPFLMQHKLNF